MKKCWCIPPKHNCEFVAQMEDVLEVYHRPHDSKRPVICLDEKQKQLIGEVREPIPASPGRPMRFDTHYRRHGVANLFIAFEPLAARRHVTVTDTRTRLDFARFVRTLVDEHYPDAERIVLVMDQLNTHSVGSLYEAFPPAEARRLARKLDVHHTPKHGSWLNMAEIELSVLGRQCLDRRIPDPPKLQREIDAWAATRAAANAGVNWHFTTDDARIKLKRLYPTFDA